MSQFKVISADEADSLCDQSDSYKELAPFSENWQLSLKTDGTFHLYWYLPLSQRELAIKQWKHCQPRINAFIGKRSITTVSWEDEPLHPINNLGVFYVQEGRLHSIPLAPNERMSNKHLYRFLLSYVKESQISSIYDGHSFMFSKNEWSILQQLCIRDGIPEEVAYAVDMIIVSLQADNERFVVVVE